jgi:hypothetical protein
MTLLDGTGGPAIARNCPISAGRQLYSHNTGKMVAFWRVR